MSPLAILGTLPASNSGHIYVVSYDGNIFGLVGVGVFHCKCHLCAPRARDLADRTKNGHIFGWLSVNSCNDVVGIEPGRIRRSVGYQADNLQNTRSFGNLYADAGELLRHILFKIPDLPRPDQTRIRVQGAEGGL